MTVRARSATFGALMHAPRVAPAELKTRIYLALVATFLTALLIADVTAGKFFQAGSLSISVGIIPFPITFVLTDLVNEYYGREGARLMTAVGGAMLVFAFLMITAARLLPAAENSPIPQASFVAVFGMSWRFFGASLGAFLLGQFADIQAFHVVKRITQSRLLWLRATGSTAISQVVDTVFVNAAALAGIETISNIAKITAWSYAYKMGVAILLTPLLYAAHQMFTSRLGIQAAPAETPGEAAGVQPAA